jgi:heme-degrading monooxygenase HmoA
MIARKWHGMVSAEKSESYHNYLIKTGLKDYASVPGNRGVFLFKRTENNITHFDTLTFWDNIAAIKRFAGENYEKARYYPKDKEYLLEFEEQVTHYEVLEADGKFR